MKENVHLIGIGGSGMSALAKILFQKGFHVSGSDIVQTEITDSLMKMGIEIKFNHDRKNIKKDMKMVVYSAAIKINNPELDEANKRDIKTMKYAQMLGLLMRDKYGIAVSGTHGKTTTTAMIAHVLERGFLDPTFIIGGEVSALGGSSKIGDGEIFVAEACEYEKSFHNLRPRAAIIMNIEEDHLDYYKGIDEIVDAFGKFSRLVSKKGILIVNGDDPNAMKASKIAKCNVETFGLGHKNDWTVRNVGSNDGFYSYDVVRRGRKLSEVKLGVAGIHNMLNSLAVVATANWLGLNKHTVTQTLATFKGVKRRFEILKEVDGITFVDDYAHHPTEIKVVLKTARDVFIERRIICVFQPHQYSRTRFFLNDFASAFGNADKIILPDIYFVRDSEEDRRLVNSRDLAKLLKSNNKDALYIESFKKIITYLRGKLETGDVLITMGAGDIHKVANEIIRLAEADEKIA